MRPRSRARDSVIPSCQSDGSGLIGIAGRGDGPGFSRRGAGTITGSACSGGGAPRRYSVRHLCVLDRSHEGFCHECSALRVHCGIVLPGLTRRCSLSVVAPEAETAQEAAQEAAQDAAQESAPQEAAASPEDVEPAVAPSVVVDKPAVPGVCQVCKGTSKVLLVLAPASQNRGRFLGTHHATRLFPKKSNGSVYAVSIFLRNRVSKLCV